MTTAPGPDTAAVARTEFLRRLPLFAELADGDLRELCRLARTVPVPAGTLLMEEGTPGDGLYVVRSGELEVTRREGGEEVVLAVRGAGEVLGEMSLLEQAPRSASVRALSDSELLVIAPDAFQALLTASPAAAVTVLRTVAGRLRSTEAMLMQREKLASLGTLAAGLAHELNNPAAAARRSAAHLKDALGRMRAAGAELGRLPHSPAVADALGRLEVAFQGEVDGPRVRAIDLAEAEERLVDWLEGKGLDDAWDVAPHLVARGWDGDRLAGTLSELEPEPARVVIRWFAAVAEVHALAREVERSAAAISAIVRAVRTYTFLDEAPVQPVDLRESLEDTLLILRHKLKDGVRVVRDYPAELPRVEAYGSELNQVWTNLIDNAVDAMAGRGTLELRVLHAGDRVVVEIADTGAGIPAAIRERIFDPFFTTKGPGSGTGLGLHIAHNIVVNRHRGRLELESAPGRTLFRATLPLRRP
jgi:signal transduction histidine kinase